MSKEGKVKKEEKIVRLLEYLKKYTDEDNPASIPQIERYFAAQGHPNFFGNKNTRKDMIKELVRAINTDIEGNLLPYEKWRVVYDDFKKENIQGILLESHHIVNIYYRQDFDSYEIDLILRSINNNAELKADVKELLVNRVNENLKNMNYGKKPMTPAERMKENWREKRINKELERNIERKRSRWE